MKDVTFGFEVDGKFFIKEFKTLLPNIGVDSGDGGGDGGSEAVSSDSPAESFMAFLTADPTGKRHYVNASSAYEYCIIQESCRRTSQSK